MIGGYQTNIERCHIKLNRSSRLWCSRPDGRFQSLGRGAKLSLRALLCMVHGRISTCNMALELETAGVVVSTSADLFVGNADPPCREFVVCDAETGRMFPASSSVDEKRIIITALWSRRCSRYAVCVSVCVCVRTTTIERDNDL